MTWTPQAQVIDLVPIADNLLTYIEANQTDALEWANGGPGLKDFAKFYTNASGRLQTIFPSLMILAQSVETDLGGDILIGGWEITLEGTVGGPNPDDLVKDVKRYAKAVESILVNIPSSSLMADNDSTYHASIFELETRHDVARRESQTAWFQIFQTRCIYRITTAAY